MLLVEPTSIPPRLHLPLATTQPIGAVLSLVACSYLAWCIVCACR